MAVGADEAVTAAGAAVDATSLLVEGCAGAHPCVVELLSGHCRAGCARDAYTAVVPRISSLTTRNSVAKQRNTFEKRRRETDKKMKAAEKRKKRETKKLFDAKKPSPTNSTERVTPETSEGYDE